MLAAGHTPAEAESAFRAALDRWRALSAETAVVSVQTLRFAGSHDPAISLVASRFTEICPGCALEVSFTGSLGGLIALAEGKADLAGSHLWDEESDSYNAPFVQRLLPGRRIALLTLAHRRLGLIVPPGNPGGLTGLADLTRPGLRFVNRQRGAGTRVWLDAQLRRLGIPAASIAGYEREAATHEDVARAVAEGRADAGLGIEAAALSYGLGFVFLAIEPYDLVIPAEMWDTAPVQALAAWLRTADARAQRSPRWAGMRRRTQDRWLGWGEQRTGNRVSADAAPYASKTEALTLPNPLYDRISRWRGQRIQL